MQELIALSHCDVPRFAGCLMLASLALMLRENQSLRLTGDPTVAESYLTSFFAYQPKKKNEQEYITCQYLRNRAGDLTLWYAIPQLLNAGFNPAGDPVIVTKDKALFRLIFRLIPPVISGNQSKNINFCPAFNEFPEGEWQNWHKLILQLNMHFVPPRDDAVKLRRLQNLFEFAKKCCDDEREVQELDVAWSDWIEPGFGKDIRS